MYVQFVKRQLERPDKEQIKSVKLKQKVFLFNNIVIFIGIPNKKIFM